MAASSVLTPFMPSLGGDFDPRRDHLMPASAQLILSREQSGSGTSRGIARGPAVTEAPAGRAPTPSVVLDHLSFPHIMDLIIQYAPHSSRIALRAASRHYRDRMDKLLCGHIKINNRVILSHFTAPFFQGKIPGLRFNLDVTPACRARCLSLLHQHCRVVDYYRSVGLLFRDREDLGPALANVQLVRRQDPVLCHIRTPTIVDFLLVSPRSLRADWFTPLGVGVAPIPEGATTMIVSVIYHPHHPRLPDCQLNIISFARYLQRVVVILTPRTEGLPPAPPSVMNRPEHRLGLLCCVVDAMSLRIPDVKFTLVGVDELDALWLGLPASLSSKERENTILDAIEAEWKQWRPSELQRGVRAHDYVEFLTRQEYRQHVGQYEYELHTVED